MRTDTEFMAEVVEVHDVRPHPNADRLEILGLFTAEGPLAYTVVARKGEFPPGSLAAYLSVDATVPMDGETPEGLRFLGDLQGNTGKAVVRVRAARLRGVYSEGVCVPAPEGLQLGDDVALPWRIGYHNPDAAAATVAGTPTGPRATRPTAWLDSRAPQYGVTSLKKAPYLFEPGTEVIVTEKIHGTNFRFGWVRRPRSLRYVFAVGSHRTWKTDVRTWWQRAVDRIRGRTRRVGSWYGEDLYSQAALEYQLEPASRDYRGIVFYGELYGRTASGAPIQQLTYGATDTHLRLFDAYDTEGRRWWSRAELAVAAADMGVDVAPVLDAGPFDLERVKELAEGATTLWEPSLVVTKVDKEMGIITVNAPTAHTREGVVVEAADRAAHPAKGKWVGAGYKLATGVDK